jgi:hypothetical protein
MSDDGPHSTTAEVEMHLKHEDLPRLLHIK